MHALISGPCGPLQSDGLAGWLEAIGTLGAFAIALYLASVAISERTKRQAGLVSAYVRSGILIYGAGQTADRPAPPEVDQSSMPFSAQVADSTGLPLGFREGKVTFARNCARIDWVLENRSDEMISDVVVELVNEQGVVIHSEGPVPVVSPEHKSSYATFMDTGLEHVSGVIQARATFVDAVGRCWERQSGSPLRRRHRRR